MFLREAFYKRGVVITFVICSVGHFLLHFLQSSLHLRVIGKRLTCFFAHGGVILQLHHLWQIAYGDIIRNGNNATRGLLKTAKYLQHRRFSCTILPNKRYSVTIVHNKTHVGEQRLHTKFNL